MLKNRTYIWMAAGSAMGLTASFWQMMEKLMLIKNQNAALSCNLNGTFSCSNVLNAHQASVLGPPNALIGVMMFSFFLAISLAALSGTQIARKLVLTIEGLALFMLAFTFWFLYQSVFNIGSVCVFCIFVGTGVLFINAVMLRSSLLLLNLSEARRLKLERALKSGADIFGWMLVWLTAALVMFLRFA